MCGGAIESNPTPSEKEIIISNDSIPENQKKAQEDFKESQENNTQTAPPPPSVNFDIVEIYNTKLISDICEDATQIETTSQECLLQYRDNLEIVFGYAEELKMYMDNFCLLYTSPSPRDVSRSRMPSSA